MWRQAGCDDASAELAIVDVFTRLIFSDDEGFGLEELRVVEALRGTTDNLVGASHAEIGYHLRTLGAGELAGLVVAIRDHLCRLPGGAQDGRRNPEHGRRHPTG